MNFELNKEFIEQLQTAIQEHADVQIESMVKELHPADIAEILGELETEERQYLINLLPEEITADTIVELEEDERGELLKDLPSQEIAHSVIEHVDSDDAADIISELPEDKQDEVLSNISDIEQAGDIVDLLNYAPDSAGGLMATELVSVNEELTVRACIEEIRKQASEVDEFFYVFVTDSQDMLKGVLHLKKLLLAKDTELIKNLIEDIRYVKTDDDCEEVANIMRKYDLVSVPVVDSIGRLKGRITIDDVVDVIKDEAEEDYQLMSGITGDIDSNDSVFKLTRARIPWLLIGLAGGILGSVVIGGFDSQLIKHPEMAFFIPLIAAMGGNVAIQSSSIIVQGLANNSLGLDSASRKIIKEVLVALVNGSIVALIALIYNMVVGQSFALCLTVSISLITVVLFAAIVGTSLPLAFEKIKIDPAVATGPFITTTNDIMGMIIYFFVSFQCYSWF
ncbi:MAG: magnesium transporter [Salinivirgaceae bacterium]|nr:magnesium transporter [Salinivirgaceae bacterium]MBO7593588.1 magnesium transporter [Salinivirgaceae bacterium]MBR5168815.1 magnesium transporter [Salinivirgaceae bacterium]